MVERVETGDLVEIVSIHAVFLDAFEKHAGIAKRPR
jgi:hypothetical protein